MKTNFYLAAHCRTALLATLLATTSACDTAISPGVADDADIAAIAESCQGCHNGALSLASGGAEELAGQMQAMAEGKAAHPVPLPELSADQRRQLAAALTNK